MYSFMDDLFGSQGTYGINDEILGTRRILLLKYPEGR